MKTTREVEFERFHAAHEDVYREIVQRSREVKAVGFQTFGMRRIWEGLRWFYALKSGPTTSEFKLNDHLVPYYARLVMEQEPDLKGFFVTRKLHSEEVQS